MIHVLFVSDSFLEHAIAIHRIPPMNWIYGVNTKFIIGEVPFLKLAFGGDMGLRFIEPFIVEASAPVSFGKPDYPIRDEEHAEKKKNK